MTIEKATLQEEVDNMRAEEAQMREENKVYKTLLLDKQTYEERLRKLENERERKVDVEQEYANLRRKCAALEANADSLSTQLLELSAANAELTRAKADREAAKSLAESKAVEHMREKTVSERQRDKLVADNRKLTAENDELNKTYSNLLAQKTDEQAKAFSSGIGPLNICCCHHAPEFDVDLWGQQQYSALRTSAGKRFYYPSGALIFGLAVRGRYDGGDAWMGPFNTPGAWAVAYHGTTRENAVNIIKYGFHMDKSVRQSYGRGIYCTPDPYTAALDYATVFSHNGKRYRVVIEVGVDPAKVKSVANVNMVKNEYWLVRDASGIRPFAVCIFGA